MFRPKLQKLIKKNTLSKLLYFLIGIFLGVIFLFFYQNLYTSQNEYGLTPPTHTVDIEKVLQDNPQILECVNQKEGKEEECINKYLKGMSEQRGGRPALDLIEAATQKYPQLLTWAHPFAHTVGQHSFRFYDKQSLPISSKIGRALVECDGFGSFGCYHGVIEVSLGKIPVEQRTNIVRKACVEDPLITQKPYYQEQCAHWFGHAVAIFANGTLMQALSMCEGLDPNWGHGAVQLCLSGVFHAGLAPGEISEDKNVNLDNVFKAGDPYYPCLDIPEKFRGHCYSHAYGRARSADIGVQLKTCDDIPESDARKKRTYAGGCYDSVGNNVIEMSNFDPKIAVENCQKYASYDLRKYCYGGAARYWVLRNPLLENTKPLELCSKAEESAKPHCFARAGFGNYENFASQEILNQFCSKAETSYQEYCRRRTAPDDFTGGYVKG